MTTKKTQTKVKSIKASLAKEDVVRAAVAMAAERPGTLARAIAIEAVDRTVWTLQDELDKTLIDGALREASMLERAEKAEKDAAYLAGQVEFLSNRLDELKEELSKTWQTIAQLNTKLADERTKVFARMERVKEECALEAMESASSGVESATDLYEIGVAVRSVNVKTTLDEENKCENR